MNFVFLSPHFPPNWYLFAAALRDEGATVLGIADVPDHQLRPELRDALSAYYRVHDMNDYDQLVRALGHFTAQHGKLDRLDSLNEWGWRPRRTCAPTSTSRASPPRRSGG